MNYNRLRFKLGYSIHRPQVLRFYNDFTRNINTSEEKIYKDQNSRLVHMIEYCYENISYYRDLFDSIGLKPKDIAGKEDLYKIPILTKSILKKNIERFYPDKPKSIKYIDFSSGGSTGSPLKYRVSQESYNAGFALLFRGWGFAGYELGDKVAIIAGGSLVKKDLSFLNKLKDYMYSFKHYAAYAMDDGQLRKYARDMIDWQPKFIRGYPSSIYPLAKFIQKNGLESSFNIKGVFTTSEMLYLPQRKFISEVFDCEVFDTYGLHDGGITAFECNRHTGMHIDTERSILECVNQESQNIYGQEGKIIATTLIEYSLPLLRYDTGDLGILSEAICPCGCKRPLLKELRGRITDILDLNGKHISSPALVTLMGTTSVEQYQIVQKRGEDKLLFRLQTDVRRLKDEESIKESLFSQVGPLDIEFEYVDTFVYPNGEKHKLVILEDYVQ